MSLENMNMEFDIRDYLRPRNKDKVKFNGNNSIARCFMGRYIKYDINELVEVTEGQHKGSTGYVEEIRVVSDTNSKEGSVTKYVVDTFEGKIEVIESNLNLL